ncbi:hypothetical protein JCM8097_002250 [Rhodosporidiobolus ruineniae]
MLLLPLLLVASLSSSALALPYGAPNLLRRADDTGCNMNQGSDLMQCLGTWASIPPVASATGAGVGSEAAQLTQIANCWGNGTYCREWLPVKTAADKLCALALSASSAAPSSTTSTLTSVISLSTSSSDGNLTTSVPTASTLVTAVTAVASGAAADAVPSETFSSVVAEASRVITSIWNNDSGTDIPSITNDVGTQTNPTWTAESGSAGSAAATSATTSANGGAAAEGGASGGSSAAARTAGASGFLVFLAGAAGVLAIRA